MHSGGKGSEGADLTTIQRRWRLPRVRVRVRVAGSTIAATLLGVVMVGGVYRKIDGEKPYGAA